MASKLKNDEMLPLGICAEWLGVSPAWLKRECREGRLSYIEATPQIILSWNRTLETLQARAQYVPSRKEQKHERKPTH